jgi:hypothetical protein
MCLLQIIKGLIWEAHGKIALKPTPPSKPPAQLNF